MTNLRGTGRTTQQIKNAPLNATFISHAPQYAREIAIKQGRDDLRIWPKTANTRGLENVVYDHFLLESRAGASE